MSPNSINRIYHDHERRFRKLLVDPNVPLADKATIAELLKKPWNPYIRRHSALTEKARILKEPILKIHAGWSQRSNMHLKYEHWFGNESSESILEAYGIETKNPASINKLQPRQCPNCNEPNKIDSKFCTKCRMVLSYDAYTETLENNEQKESEVRLLNAKYEEEMSELRGDMNKIMALIRQNPKLASVKPESLKRKLN